MVAVAWCGVLWFTLNFVWQRGLKVYQAIGRNLRSRKMTYEKIKKYFKIWWMMSRNSFSMVLTQKLALSVFLIGKVLRFIFFFGFLYFLLLGSGSLAGYTSNQIIFFYLTFNLIDVITQFLFREVYNFRPMIINGDFDLVLVKPLSALFRVLMGGADIIDLITIPPLIILTIYLWCSSSSQLFIITLLLFTSFQWFYYCHCFSNNCSCFCNSYP